MLSYLHLSIPWKHKNIKEDGCSFIGYPCGGHDFAIITWQGNKHMDISTGNHPGPGTYRSLKLAIYEM